MKFKVPVAYQAKVVGRGKRNPVTEYFYEWASIDVPSPSDDDAPIAVAWRDRLPRWPEEMEFNAASTVENFGMVPTDGVMHTRYFNEDHYWFNVRKDGYNNDSVRYRETAEQFQTRLLSGEGAWPIIIPRVTGNLVDIHPDGYPIDLSVYRSVEESTRETVLQTVMDEFHKKLLVVDGYLYVKKAEPVYMLSEVVKLGPGDYQSWIKIVPNAPEYLNPASNGHRGKTVKDIFRIDRYDDAVAASYSAFSEKKVDINGQRKATVLIDTTVTHDTDFEVAIALAKQLIEVNGEQKIGSFTRDEAISYVNLRHAVGQYEQTQDKDAIFAAAALYRDCLRRSEGSDRAKLDQIISRLLMRPLSM